MKGSRIPTMLHIVCYVLQLKLKPANQASQVIQVQARAVVVSLEEGFKRSLIFWLFRIILYYLLDNLFALYLPYLTYF